MSWTEKPTLVWLVVGRGLSYNLSMIFKISTQAKLLLAIAFVIAASLGIKEWSDQQKIEAMRLRAKPGSASTPRR